MRSLGKAVCGATGAGVGALVGLAAFSGEDWKRLPTGAGVGVAVRQRAGPQIAVSFGF